MPRRAKGPRLYLDPARGEFIIRDGEFRRRTGCGDGQREGAEKALQEYLAGKYEPVSSSDPSRVKVADVIDFYAKRIAPKHRAVETTSNCLSTLLKWWGDKYLSDVKTSTCEDYTKHRCSQTISQARKGDALKRLVQSSSPRRELGTLQAAINAYNKEFALTSVPVVTLPEKGAPRARYLTRDEVAKLLRAARRLPQDGDALARLILIGVYTGTRCNAMRELGWMPSTSNGWVNVERGVMHRRGSEEIESKKRRPPVRIPHRLLGHLRRWYDLDSAASQYRSVIRFRGATGLRYAWERARKSAGFGPEVVVHILRHTAATWMMQSGVNTWDASAVLGMSTDILTSVYGHHDPDFQSEFAENFGRRNRA